MLDLGQGLTLVGEHSGCRVGGVASQVQQLHRDVAADATIPGAPHLTEPARAEPIFEFVAISDHARGRRRLVASHGHALHHRIELGALGRRQVVHVRPEVGCAAARALGEGRGRARGDARLLWGTGGRGHAGGAQAGGMNVAPDPVCGAAGGRQGSCGRRARGMGIRDRPRTGSRLRTVRPRSKTPPS